MFMAGHGSKDPVDGVHDAHFPQNQSVDAGFAEDLAGMQQQMNNSNKRYLCVMGVHTFTRVALTPYTTVFTLAGDLFRLHRP